MCVTLVGDLASDDEYLEIPSISRQRAGTYECTAVNDIDTDVQTVDITVNCESDTYQCWNEKSFYQLVIQPKLADHVII